MIAFHSLDFSSVDAKTEQFIDMAARYTIDDLRAAASESVDWMLALLEDATDADVVFDPIDPQADDPYAKEQEEKIGWSLAHLVAHVTATSDEWASYSPILARGIAYPAEPRLRNEVDWQTLTTVAQTRQRLVESRRQRLAALDAWPDVPNLETRRVLSPRFEAWSGPMNATASFLLGLHHELQHRAQFEDVKGQAVAGRAKA